MDDLIERLKKRCAGRERWYVMNAAEDGYIIDFDWQLDADRWMDRYMRENPDFIERNGYHIVKRKVFTATEELANEAIAALEAANARSAQLFDVLMRQNIMIGNEAYLVLRVVGVPPSEDEFVQSVTRAIDAAIAACSKGEREWLSGKRLRAHRRMAAHCYSDTPTNWGTGERFVDSGCPRTTLRSTGKNRTTSSRVGLKHQPRPTMCLIVGELSLRIGCLYRHRRRSKRMSEWQEISTAPRDGTRIILSKAGMISVGEWLHEEGGTTEYRDADGRYMGQDDSDGFDGWMDWEGGYQDWTHWMPMPDPVTPAIEPDPESERDTRTIDMFSPETE